MGQGNVLGVKRVGPAELDVLNAAHCPNGQYGATLAVDGLSFTVRPGLVTGFLGRNGAGKSTAMRLILGLDRPACGEVTLGGRRYQDLGT